jgi:prepilin-type N-terminal cleavage/methylation domain-containing protein
MVRAENVGGFTLLEVVVAVVIAAISLIGIYAASTQCLKQIWSARETSRAALAADYEVENLCTTPWSNITAYGSSYTMSVSNNPALALLNGGSGTVQLTPLTGNANVLQATVALTWTGRDGTLKTNIAATTIISENSFLR